MQVQEEKKVCGTPLCLSGVTTCPFKAAVTENPCYEVHSIEDAQVLFPLADLEIYPENECALGFTVPELQVGCFPNYVISDGYNLICVINSRRLYFVDECSPTSFCEILEDWFYAHPEQFLYIHDWATKALDASPKDERYLFIGILLDITEAYLKRLPTYENDGTSDKTVWQYLTDTTTNMLANMRNVGEVMSWKNILENAVKAKDLTKSFLWRILKYVLFKLSPTAKLAYEIYSYAQVLLVFVSRWMVAITSIGSIIEYLFDITIPYVAEIRLVDSVARASQLAFHYVKESFDIDSIINSVFHGEVQRTCVREIVSCAVRPPLAKFREMCTVWLKDFFGIVDDENKYFKRHVQQFAEYSKLWDEIRTRSLASADSWSIPLRYLGKTHSVETWMKEMYHFARERQSDMKIFKGVPTSWTFFCKEVITAYSEMTRSFKASHSRMEPLGILFSGHPGLGKSLLMSVLPICVLKELDPDLTYPEREIWNSPIASDYADNYMGQKWVNIDDLGANQDDPNNKSLINMISCAGMSVNQAALEAKGMMFTSDFVLASTNLRSFRTVNGLTDYKALVRRFPFAYEVQRNEIGPQEFLGEVHQRPNKANTCALLDKFLTFRTLDMDSGATGTVVPAAVIIDSIITAYRQKKVLHGNLLNFSKNYEVYVQETAGDVVKIDNNRTWSEWQNYLKDAFVPHKTDMATYSVYKETITATLKESNSSRVDLALVARSYEHLREAAANSDIPFLHYLAEIDDESVRSSLVELLTGPQDFDNWATYWPVIGARLSTYFLGTTPTRGVELQVGVELDGESTFARLCKKYIPPALAVSIMAYATYRLYKACNTVVSESDVGRVKNSANKRSGHKSNFSIRPKAYVQDSEMNDTSVVFCTGEGWKNNAIVINHNTLLITKHSAVHRGEWSFDFLGKTYHCPPDLPTFPLTFEGTETDAQLVRLPVKIDGVRSVVKKFITVQHLSKLAGRTFDAHMYMMEDTLGTLRVRTSDTYYQDGQISIEVRADVSSPLTGFCGSPYYINEGERKLFGIHNASSWTPLKRYLYIVPVVRESLQQGIAVLDKLIAHTDDPRTLSIMGVDVETSDYKLESGMHRLGAMYTTDGYRMSTNQPHTTSIIRATHATKYEDNHLPSQKGNDLLMQNALKYKNTCVRMSSMLIFTAVMTHLRSLFSKALPPGTGRQLTDDEVLNGNSENSAINMTTSCGYWTEFGVTKEDLFVKNDAVIQVKDTNALNRWTGKTFIKQWTDFRASLKTPHVFVEPWMTCLKDELRPVHKVFEGKTRTFESVSVIMQLELRRFFGDFVGKARGADFRCLKHGIGQDPLAYWNRYYDYLTNSDKFKQGFACDYSKYDGTVCDQAWDVFERLANDFYGDRNKLERHNLLYIMKNAIHVCGREWFISHCGNKSGNPMTDIFNSITNMWLIETVFTEIWYDRTGQISSTDDLDVRYLTYGDDMIVVASDFVLQHFNQETFIRAVERYGYIATDASKGDKIISSSPIQELTYLKAPFVRDGDIVRMPLPLETIYKMLNWTKKNLRHDSLGRTNVLVDALVKAGQHDEATFNAIKDTVLRCCSKDINLERKRIAAVTYALVEKDTFMKQHDSVGVLYPYAY